ncbi:YmfL family putative regulatory protein [Neisseria sp. S1]|uniref:YmfL family putative regulatory protein n=1 Tax=Neisseria sp. S1 TaxID=3318354 RepID=UPI003A841010
MDAIKQSIKSMCQSVAGGYATMAAMLGLSSKAALENRIYEVKGQRVSIEEAMMMQRLAESTAFAEAVAAESGGVFVKLPDADLTEEDIQAVFMSLSESVGLLVSEWKKATEDGELKPAEEKRLRAVKRKICGQSAAIIALTRKYYTREGE